MSKKRLLIIDDEPLVLKSVSMALTFAGYAVESAASGAEALRKLKSSTYDLIVTDWKMPEMKGDDLAGRIRSRHPHLPILLLTGSILEEPPSGFDKVLYKPFSMDELREAVATLSAKRKQAQEKDARADAS